VFGFAQYDGFGRASLENIVEAFSAGNSDCFAHRGRDGFQEDAA
jgi:hypothetical protein